MTTWVFVCDKEGWYQKVEEFIERARKALALHNTIQAAWTCGRTKRIQVGDAAYFYRSGSKPHGFFARGVIVPALTEDQTRLKSGADSNLSAAYTSMLDDLRVTIELDSVTDYDFPLNIDILKTKKDFQGANFLFRDSGMSFREEYIDSLNSYWETHISELIKSGKAASNKLGISKPGVGEEDLKQAQIALNTENYFKPASPEIDRNRVARSIIERRGQPQFRQDLLKAYNNHCAITGFDAEEALEAAHIIPYSQNGTNHPSNGLLMRADIHTLFDLNLVAVEPETLIVSLAPHLQKTSYGSLHGSSLSYLPSNREHQPNQEALRYRWNQIEWLIDRQLP